MKKRRTFSAQFKSQVVLSILQGTQTHAFIGQDPVEEASTGHGLLTSGGLW